MTGFEPAKSPEPKSGAIPNFATSRYSIFGAFLTSVGYYVVVATFGGFFGNPSSRKFAVLKGCLRFQEKVLNESGRSPKCRALPTAPHPDNYLIVVVQVVKYVVKHIFDCFFHFPNRPKSARLKGFRRFLISCSADTVYAPKADVLPTVMFTYVISLNFSQRNAIILLYHMRFVKQGKGIAGNFLCKGIAGIFLKAFSLKKNRCF